MNDNKDKTTLGCENMSADEIIDRAIMAMTSEFSPEIIAKLWGSAIFVLAEFCCEAEKDQVLDLKKIVSEILLTQLEEGRALQMKKTPPIKKNHNNELLQNK